MSGVLVRVKTLLQSKALIVLVGSFNMILVKEHSPCAASLGSVNGLAQVAQCLARAIAPTFVRSVTIQSNVVSSLISQPSCLFALSVRSEFLGGHTWTIVMAMFSIFAWLLSVSIPDMRACAEPGQAQVYVVE